jgi:ABC-2 type transport system permease protein
MARRDPLLPNAAIVARREYRDRVRSRLYLASTVILMLLALGVTLTPIALRYLESRSVTTIAVVTSEPGLSEQALGFVDSLLNNRAAEVPAGDAREPFVVVAVPNAAAAIAGVERGDYGGVLVIERRESGQLHFVYRSAGVADTVRSQLIGFASMGTAILDWTANIPDAGGVTFRPPEIEFESLGGPTVDGRQISQEEIVSRQFLGTVFIVLMFISILIYGMWVATGVAAEKSSRVMELMISAASPRQLVIGKVLGIGGAGLTQYIAIAIPALLVLAFQDRIAELVLGPGGAAGAPVAGLTAPLLLGYGTLFLLGFTLYAFVYAAVGSFVSRPDDLQTLSLPLSLLAMGGYLSALVVLLGGGGLLGRVASFVPPFSPFAMLARLMVGAVQPWEVAVSVGILLLSITVVALATVRIYATGVLLYGQRPGLRRFIAAARHAG